MEEIAAPSEERTSKVAFYMHFVSHHFGFLEDPKNPDNKIEAIPTGIIRIKDEFFVTLFGGCPYPSGSGKLVAVDKFNNQRLSLIHI